MSKDKSEARSLKVDTRWFQNAIRNADLSQNRLAAVLGIDKGALSLMLNGKRKMTLDEAARLAEILNLPVDEVLAHAGAKLPKGPKSVPVIATIDATGELHPKKAGSRAPSHDQLPGDVVAARCEDAASPLYGWTFYYLPVNGVGAEAIGRSCVVTLANKAQYILTPRRGFDAGVYNLQSLTSVSIESQRIISAAPVLWIKT